MNYATVTDIRQARAEAKRCIEARLTQAHINAGVLLAICDELLRRRAAEDEEVDSRQGRLPGT